MLRFSLLSVALLVFLAAGCTAPVATTDRPTLTATAVSPTRTVTATSTKTAPTPLPATATPNPVKTATPAGATSSSSDAPSPEQERVMFTGHLKAWLSERDAESIREMMNDSFVLSIWRSENTTLTRAQAVEQLKAMGQSGYKLTFTDAAPPGVTLESMGSGTLAATVYANGFGKEGKGEAVFVVMRDATGKLYLHGMLYAPDGFKTRLDAMFKDTTAGFQLAYPSNWTLQDANAQAKQSGRGYYATLMSWPQQTPYAGELPPNGTLVQVQVNLWEPVDLDQYVAHRKEAWANSTVQILKEELWTLAGDTPAVSLLLKTDRGTNFILLTLIHKRFITISGEGDSALASQIARTLQPINTP